MSSNNAAEIAAIQATCANESTQVACSEVLTFQVAGQEYAVSILDVQEIRGYEKPARLPNAPLDFLGLLNLRGSFVPTYDLRLKLSASAEYTPRTVSLILRTKRGLIGVVADAVCDVVATKDCAIHAPPMANKGLPIRQLLSMQHEGSTPKRLIQVLDLVGLFDQTASC